MSTDSGATWTQSNSGPPNTSIMALPLDPRHPQTLYAGDNLNGLFQSTDGGTTWNARNSGLPDPLPSVYRVVVDPTNTAVLYLAIGTTGIFKSDNAAGAWQKLPVTSSSCDFRALAIAGRLGGSQRLAAGARVRPAASPSAVTYQAGRPA